MPIINGPMPDPEEAEFDEPQAKALLRASYTYAKRLRDFRQVFHRDPTNTAELDAFVEEYLREAYNEGREAIE
jgi:hypothetical protein